MNILDISHWQGMIDFYKVANDNVPKVDGVFIKATNGNSIDTMLKYNAVQANRENLPISYYHFATLNSPNVTADAQGEAEFFIKSISNLPKNNFPLALDIETNKAGLDRNHVLTWINTFYARTTQLGYSGSYLYSYADFLNQNLPVNHNLGNVPLWIAAYTPTLKLPAGWQKETLWQFTSQGKINGVHTVCDLNRSDQPLF